MKNFVSSITLVLVISTSSFAQYCTPRANCANNDFIDFFTFANASNLNSNGSNCGSRFFPGNAYDNTGISINVVQGSTYSFSIQASTAIADPAQGFGMWIDFNSDGDFDDNGEFVYSSAPTKNMVRGSVTVPFTSAIGTTRLRVRSLPNAAPLSTTACNRYNRGETEDYDFVISKSPTPPVPDFEVSTNTSCIGRAVQFTDKSLNFPTGWLWKFGDGSSSTQQHPTHSYSNTGNYTVTLIAQNTHGQDSIVKTGIINVSSAPSIASACIPTTNSNTTGFGITYFSIASSSSNTQDARAGYEDHTCTSDTLVQGNSYTLRFGSKNAPALQNFRAWLDFNGDGLFTNQELIASVNDADSVNVPVTIGSNTIVNQMVRLRLAGAFNLTAPANANFTSCATLSDGQMEDYAMYIKANNLPPIAKFEVEDSLSCNGSVQFLDRSENVPLSWHWDFGDGNTSNQQNPVHTYANSGRYTVSFTATNNFGASTDTSTHRFYVDLNRSIKPASCAPTTLQHRADYGIHQFSFDGSVKSSNDGSVGYEDFSCSDQFAVKIGKTYALNVTTGSQNPEDVHIYLDADTNGTFSSNELVFSSSNQNLHSGNLFIPKTTPTNVPIRLRIISDIVGNIAGPCHDPINGQVEDYAIVASIDPNFPLADFSVDSNVVCMGSVQFTDLSAASTTSHLWDFGDGNTSTLANPSHTYSTPGTYNVSLIASNSSGSDTMRKISYITFDPNACVAYKMTDAQVVTNTQCNGKLTDDGEGGDYNNNVNAVFTIAPSGAQSVKLNFTSFHFDSGDSLFIYDGMDTNATLIGAYSGAILPNGGIINSSNPSITIQQKTNSSAVDSGFTMSWNCVTPTALPQADFSATPLQFCNEMVKFTDGSSGNPSSWFWDFGDGNTSTSQNPSHYYTTDGVYDVTLTVTNSNGTDTKLRTSYITRSAAFCENSIAENANGISGTMYPNPVDNVLHIVFSEIDVNEIDITLSNVLGQPLHLNVISSSHQGVELDVSGLPSGIYNISIQTTDGLWSNKFIKN